MMRRLDAWIGRSFFHPPIIWVCQRAGINQHAFYRYAWWTVALHAVWMDRGQNWKFLTWDAVFAIARTLSVSIAPERDAITSGYVRAFLAAFAILAAVSVIAFGKGVEGLANVLLALAAEYATTIKTIPPRKVREDQLNRREQAA